MRNKTQEVLGLLGIMLGLLLVGLVGVQRDRVANAADGEVPTPQQNVVQVYRLDNVTSAFRANVTVADIAALGSTFNAASPLFGDGSATTGGARQTIGLQPRFQQAADTCKVRVAYYSSTSSTASPYRLSREITFTAGSIKDASGFYYADDPYDFDSCGALGVRFVVTTAGAARVDLWPGSR